jgi:hypothetical protein
VFERTVLGSDPTDGRYADVAINRCRTCTRTWLQYQVEYEAFSRSGRWARGVVTREQASAVTPETAADLLHGLPWYLYGGSYFDGVAGRKTGPMRWAP